MTPNARKTMNTSPIIIALLALAASAATAQDLEIGHIRPSTTGIPGDQVITGAIGPDARLWVAARYPFWGEGGVGVFNGDTWTTHANVNSPMPSQWVHDIGFDGPVTWMATEGGVVRLEGDDWTIFDRSNSPFPTNEARSIAVAPNGDVWVALRPTTTTFGGVAHYDGDTWEVFTTSTGLPWTFSDAIGSVAIDATGRPWVTHSSSAGIAFYDGRVWTLEEPTFARLEHPAADGLGRVIVASSGTGLYIRDGGVWTRSLSGIDVSTTSADDANRFWAGSSNGSIHVYDGFWTEVANIGEYVEAITFDPSGRVKAIGRLSTHWIDGFAATPTHNAFNTGMTDYFVDDIHVDAEGHAWFAGGTGQICESTGTTWNGFNHLNLGAFPWPFETAPATGVAHTPDGNTWITTRQGLGRWDGTDWTVFDTDTSDVHDYYLSDVTVDSNGAVWVCSDTGVSSFDGTTWDYSLQATPVDRLFADDSGNVYACGRSGLTIFDGTSWTPFPAPLPDGHVHEVAFAHDGTLWIGTGEGLVHWDGATTTTYDTTNSDIPGNNVRSLVVDHDGLLWVAGRSIETGTRIGGVASFDGTTWDRYMAYTTPISHHQIEKIAVDADGNILVSSYSEAVDIILAGSDCRADLDGDGSLTIFDFLTFQTAFDAMDLIADFDGDGSFTIFDFLAFQTAFDAGCE